MVGIVMSSDNFYRAIVRATVNDDVFDGHIFYDLFLNRIETLRNNIRGIVTYSDDTYPRDVHCFQLTLNSQLI